MDGSSATKIGIGVLAIGAIVGIGYLIYKGSKNEREVRNRIAAKEGSAGLARYEDAKTKREAVGAGLGILSGLANGGLRRNKKNRRTSRRRSLRNRK